MKNIIGILLILVVASCGKEKATETELQAVNGVLEFYGGACKYHKGTVTKKGVTEKFFELEIRESKLIESFSNRLEIPASNIAYLFFSNLKDEQYNYTDVKVKLLINNGKTSAYSYPVGELKEIDQLIPILNRVSQLIKTQSYQALLLEFDTVPESSMTFKRLVDICSPIQFKYGLIERVQFQGCAFYERPVDKRPMVHVAGMMIRKKGNVPISLFIDRKSRKIVDLKFQFRGLSPEK
jgi:hypothetical protein